MRFHAHGVKAVATVAALAAAVPPLNGLLTGQMLTHMLVQIPLLFACGVLWGAGILSPADSRWRTWNLQGVAGLLFAALVLTYWMTPIALDHATAGGVWALAKVLSLALAGVAAGSSWRLGSVVAQLFYGGNMLWMMMTAGMLYADSAQRLCNAYLWDDQVRTGQGLMVLSILGAGALLALAVRTRPGTPESEWTP